MTHITILALGSRGDVQPYVALGRGLQQAGYGVRLAAPENFAGLAAENGLDFAAIAPDSQAVMAGETGRRMMTSGSNGPAFIHLLAKLVSDYADECLTASLKACEGTDAILFNSFAQMGYHIAEALNLPAAGAWIYPLHRSAEFPSMGAPPFLRGGSPLNWLTHVIDEQMVQHAFGRIFALWRRTLGLAPLPLTGFYEHVLHRKLPQIYAYSPSVVPRPADWAERMVVTGYWFLEQNVRWQPSEALCAFLEAGSPPIYIGFGSVVGDHGARLADVVVDAIRQSGQRAIVGRGWGGIDMDRIAAAGGSVFVADNIPHDWLFPRMAAVVHHGGAGTTAAGLRAGVPSVIVPFSGDQPFWGERVRVLGVGTPPIPHTRLTARRLGEAIHEATHNPVMRDRAQALGQRIAAEDGIARAVEAVERWVISARTDG